MTAWQRALSHLIAVGMLAAWPAVAMTAQLSASREVIAVGEEVGVKLKDTSFLDQVEWSASGPLTEVQSKYNKAIYRGTAPGLATISVRVDGTAAGSVSVRVIGAGEAVPTPVSAPPVIAAPAAGRDDSSPVVAAPATGLPGKTPPALVSLAQAGQITLIQTYHWNGGRGAPPGRMALRDASGREYGPWPAAGSPGPDGTPNIYWSVRPMLTLPAGVYTLVDSDPASWTPDPQNGGRGFSRHEVQAAPAQAPGQAPGQPSAQPAPYQPAAPGAARVLLEVGNDQPVSGHPGKASKLDLGEPHIITLIRTLHWNDGRGAYPGSIGLRCRDGSQHGPWQARGEAAGGVANAYWRVEPNIALPACVCSVEVSDPASWSHNEASGKRGFVRIEGYAQAGASAGNAPGDAGMQGLDRANDAVRRMDETRRAMETLINIFK